MHALIVRMKLTAAPGVSSVFLAVLYYAVSSSLLSSALLEVYQVVVTKKSKDIIATSIILTTDKDSNKKVSTNQDRNLLSFSLTLFLFMSL